MEYFYCVNCNKPLTVTWFKYCKRCDTIHTFKDFHYSKTIVHARGYTREYAFHLSKRIRGYYAHTRDSAPREHRIPVDIPKEDIEQALVILLATLRKTFGKMTLEVFEVLHANDPHFLRRMLYKVCLFYIAYYIKNARCFKSEQHFRGSMCNTLFMENKRTHYKHINKEWFPKKLWRVKNKKRDGERFMTKTKQDEMVEGITRAITLIIRHYG